ncbi:MAG: hypothetical protein KDB53_18085 [Planctomycetes bacterium]|nr:hypothetical protein [Planctomycetota bacterium]
MAKKVRETFDKYDDVDSVVVDNTSVALLRMKKDKTPNKEVIEELLAKHAPRGVKLKSLDKEVRDQAAEKYLITVKGYA